MTTVNLYVSKDTYVDSIDHTTNFGNDINIYVSTRRQETPSSERHDRGLLEYDLSSIPSGAVITQAILHVYIYRSPDPDTTIYFKRTTAQFNETTVTWDDQPAHTNTNSTSASWTEAETWVWKTVDVTNMVKDAWAGATWFGVKTFGNLEVFPVNSTSFYHKEGYSGSTYKSYLEVTYLLDKYVKPTGSNSNDGSSWANAWRNPGYGLQNTPNGGTLHIASNSGTEYPETPPISTGLNKIIYVVVENEGTTTRGTCQIKMSP